MSPLPNRIRRLIERRPLKGDLQGQLFWLVDVILACSETGLVQEAQCLKKALGFLGKYLEQNSEPQLNAAMHELETFEGLLAQRRRG